MTVDISTSKKFGLGVIGRTLRSLRTTQEETPVAQTTRKPLDRHEVAKLFATDMRKATGVAAKPAKLNANEKTDRDTLSSIRGALYSRD